MGRQKICLLLSTEEAISIKLATKVGLLCDLDQAKQEDFIVKAATAALLPHPKPWGVKAAGAKRKASQPPHQEDLRMPMLPRYDSAPSTSLSKQQGEGRLRRDKRKPAPSMGRWGGVSLQGLTPNDLPPIRSFPQHFPLPKIYRNFTRNEWVLGVLKSGFRLPWADVHPPLTCHACRSPDSGEVAGVSLTSSPQAFTDVFSSSPIPWVGGDRS